MLLGAVMASGFGPVENHQTSVATGMKLSLVARERILAEFMEAQMALLNIHDVAMIGRNVADEMEDLVDAFRAMMLTSQRSIRAR